MKEAGCIDHAAFARRLKEVMAERGLNQSRLAARVEVQQPAVSFWLNHGLPRPAMRELLARRLDISLKWLVYGEGSKEGDFTKHLHTTERVRVKYEPLLDHYTDLAKDAEERLKEYRGKIQEISAGFHHDIATETSPTTERRPVNYRTRRKKK